jgi:sulfur carrier protein
MNGLSATMVVRVNGQDQTVPASTNVTELIAMLGATGKRIAVERNGEIVPRSEHGVTRLAEGDQLEIVFAVGGG